MGAIGAAGRIRLDMAEQHPRRPGSDSLGDGRTATLPRPSSNGSATHPSGSGGATSPSEEWSRRTFSPKPALIPVAIALVIFAIFGALALSQPPSSQTTKPSKVAPQAFAGLEATGAGSYFHPAGGEPPSDILAATRVPEGSQPGPLVDVAGGAGTYDRAVSFSVNASPAQVLSFYSSQLRADGWKIQSHGAAPNQADHEQILAQRPGGDGNYWEIGATVSTLSSGPSASSGASASGSAPSDTTSFKLELLIVDNSD